MATRDRPSTLGLRTTVPGAAALPHPALADWAAEVVGVVGVVAAVVVVVGVVVVEVLVVLVEDALPEPQAATTREVTITTAPTDHLKRPRPTALIEAITVSTLLPRRRSMVRALRPGHRPTTSPNELKAATGTAGDAIESFPSRLPVGRVTPA
jgi:hypothetical protein